MNRIWQGVGFFLLASVLCGCGQTKAPRISGITILKDRQLIGWTEYILAAPAKSKASKAKELFEDHGPACMLSLIEAMRLLENNIQIVNYMANYRDTAIKKGSQMTWAKALTEEDWIQYDDYVEYLDQVRRLANRCNGISWDVAADYLLCGSDVRNMVLKLARTSQTTERLNAAINVIRRRIESDKMTLTHLEEIYGRKDHPPISSTIKHASSPISPISPSPTTPDTQPPTTDKKDDTEKKQEGGDK